MAITETPNKASENTTRAEAILRKAKRITIVPENRIGQALMDAETGDVLVIQYTDNSRAGRVS